MGLRAVRARGRGGAARRSRPLPACPRGRWSLLAAALTAAIAGVWGPLTVPAGAAVAPSLPDGRVWEQVSPTDKDGATIASATTDPVAVSADGDALLWDTASATALPPPTEPSTAPNVTLPYVFTRAASGQWSYAPALPPDNLVLFRVADGDSLLGISSDLTTSIDQTSFGLTDGSDGLGGSLVQPIGGGSFVQNLASYAIGGSGTVLTPSVPQNQTSTYAPTYVGNSAAADHVVFLATASFPTSNCPLSSLTCAPSLAATPGPYLYDYSDGELLQVGLETGTNPSLFPSVSDPRLPGDVSSDGSKIFFEASTGAADAQLGSRATPSGNQLFVRENDRAAGAVTVPVSISTKSGSGDPNCAFAANPGGAAGTAPATLQGATADGSVAFFLSPCELTSTSDTGTSDAGQDLYAFDTNTGALTDLSVDTSAGDSATGADVQGVVGYSSDGSHVYFVADGAINGSGAPATATPKLYVSVSGAVTYLTTLSSSDSLDWGPNDAGGLDANQNQISAAQVSPSGQYVLIESVQPLTAYANGSTRELYELNAAGGSPICVSCDPLQALTGPPQIPPTGAPQIRLNSLSENGTVFFETPDALVKGDENTVNDVYEWESTAPPASSDTAADPYGGGYVSLLSSGASAISTTTGAPASAGSALIAASPSGSDVFFATHDQLVAQDEDDSEDLYDARVDGIAPPAPPKPVSPGPPMANTGPPPAPAIDNDPMGANVTTTVTRTSAVAITASLGTTTAKERTSYAKTGTVKLTLKVSGSTTASVTATATINRKTVTVARSSHTFKAAGSATLSLALSSAARKVLGARRSLKLTIKVSIAHGATHTTTVTLKR